MLNAWLHFTKNKFPTPTHIAEILEQLIFLNPLLKPNCSSNNLYFYTIQPKNITDKLMKIRYFCRFLRPGLVSYMGFKEKLGHTRIKPEKFYRHVMDLIPND